jgi:hypothetical protein
LGSFHVHTTSGLSRMDTTTALASWPNSTDEIAEAVSSPDSPPTVAEISDVASGIAGGDVRIAVDENRMNLRQRSMLSQDAVGFRDVMSYWINALLPARGRWLLSFD